MVLFRLVVYQTNCCILRTSPSLRYSGGEQVLVYYGVCFTVDTWE